VNGVDGDWVNRGRVGRYRTGWDGDEVSRVSICEPSANGVNDHITGDEIGEHGMWGIVHDRTEAKGLINLTRPVV